jgi:hypothetical protein
MVYLNDTVKRWMEENKGKLFSNTFPGGYTIIYVDPRNNIYCSDCAETIAKRISVVTTYDEGPTIYCDECNTGIESSYGDPEEEK